jgi:hypothetical protein
MGGSLPRWCAPCLLACALGSARAAEVAPAGLDYRVAPGVERCPTEAEFSALLTREVGEDPFAANPNLGLKVTLTAQTNGVSGVVEITEKGELRGRRALSSGDCSALAAALALVVGVELDPFAVNRRTRTPPADVAADVSVVPALQSTLPGEPPEHRTQWLMGVGAMMAGGLAPTVVPAVTLGASMRKPDWAGHWELGFEFQGMPPVTAPFGTGTGGTGSISHLLLTGLGCVHPLAIVGICALGTGGVAIATGQGFNGAQQSGTETQGYASAGLRVTAEVPLDPELLLVFHTDLAYQITREPLQDRAGATLWTPTLFTWNIGFALQGRIL